MIPKDFRSTLRYKDRAEPASLLADLEELSRRAAAARKRRWLWGGCLVVWLLAGIVAVVAAGGEHWCFAGIFYGAVGVVLFAVLIHLAGRNIIDERRRKLAGVVVRHLACDLRPGDKLEVVIDFNAYTGKTYQTGTEALPRYAGSSYCQPWLAVSGKLADGTSFDLGAELHARRKERTKTKGRKKVKEDLCEHVVLTLRVASLPPTAPKSWPDLVHKAPMPPGAFVHRTLVKDDRLSVTVRTHRQVRVTDKGTVLSGGDIETKLANRHTLLAPLLAAYHALHACRAG